MVCFKFEISQVDVDNLETGFQSWVIDYERCIFLFLLYHYMYTWSNKLRILDYTINMIQHMLHAVHWQFTHCFILPQLSGQWVQSGLIGPSQWNGIVEILDIILRAGSFPMHLSTNILPPMHSSPMSLSFTGSMINFLSAPLVLMLKIFSYLYVSLS